MGEKQKRRDFIMKQSFPALTCGYLLVRMGNFTRKRERIGQRRQEKLKHQLEASDATKLRGGTSAIKSVWGSHSPIGDPAESMLYNWYKN